MQYTLSLILCFVVCFFAGGLVDTKNANYTKTFVDINLLGDGIPLVVERTYNSRSLYKGIFGYGWCSNLETRVEVLPDNTLLLVECGGGAEIPFVSKQAQSNNSLKIKKIMQEVAKKKGLSKKFKKEVERDLKKSSLLQSELIRIFDIKGKPQTGKIYKAVGRQNEIIQFTGQNYKRSLPTGVTQLFSKKGVLIKEIDKSGNWIRIQRKKGKIVKVSDNKGRSLQFKHGGKGRSILKIKASRNQSAEYVIEGDNLVSVTNSQNQKYKHFYDSYHNLTKTVYPDKTYELLTYNNKKDWVMSFRNRKACIEKYNYVNNKRNKNHYWTDVKKTCKKRVTNVSKYEFWNRQKKDGTKYLYRARQNVNRYVTDITYNQNTGAPLSITRNNVTTKYAYYKTGALKSRSTPAQNVIFSNYNKCKKPQKVLLQIKRAGKVRSSQNIQLTYDNKKCHLMMAQNSVGRWVRMKRDHKGRISQMSDQSQKTIIVTYNEKFGKPNKITRPGVGSIQVFYNKNGQVDTSKTRSTPAVATQVANVFNGFLEIIAPVASDLTI